MKTTGETIVVLGATGQQGGAVVRALAARGGWRIRTLSRDPESDAARRLIRSGVEMIRADMDDPASLRAAFADAHGVFSVQGADHGSEVETRRGIAVADAARASGVSHFIYASVGGAERNSGVPHFESKWRVEQHVRDIGLPATIARPVFFMDNFREPAMRVALTALMRGYMPANKPLQMIAVADIGEWVARAFGDPASFIGKAEELAGDSLTRAEVVAAFRARGWFAGLPFPLPRAFLRPLPADVRRMFEWFAAEGYGADIEGLRVRQPSLARFGDWISREGSGV